MVEVTGLGDMVPEPGTGMLYVDLGGGWESFPMAEIAPNVYEGIFPAAFLREMKALSDEYGVDIPKGAAPQVDKAGRELVKLYGPEVLSRVAKLHFKNYHRVVNPTLF